MPDRPTAPPASSPCQAPPGYWEGDRRHVVLLGDSIFDNARYVPGGPSVIEHLRKALPSPWQATLLAQDGAVVRDVARQLARLPDDATHLVISAGGNDALGASIGLHEPADTFAEVLARLADVHEQFHHEYRAMLEQARVLGRALAVCTVYDRIPGLDRGDAVGLCVFNDVILREAFRLGLPVIDLRRVCTAATDYAPTSPIEPSGPGGGKIARAIARLLTDCDFRSSASVVFP